MDSAKFNYIRTIAECKSISKASQKLHISQPALTRYVNKLEDELGVKLLDRTTLPIKLTYAGEWYIKRVQQILDINSCMQKELQEIVNLERRKKKIGMSPGRLDHWAPHLLPEFIAAFPQVDVQFITGSHDFLENSVLPALEAYYSNTTFGARLGREFLDALVLFALCYPATWHMKNA